MDVRQPALLHTTQTASSTDAKRPREDKTLKVISLFIAYLTSEEPIAPFTLPQQAMLKSLKTLIGPLTDEHTQILTNIRQLIDSFNSEDGHTFEMFNTIETLFASLVTKATTDSAALQPREILDAINELTESLSSVDIHNQETFKAIKALFDSLTPEEQSYLSIFTSGAMSYGSISLEAHKDIAATMNILAMLLHGVTSPEALDQLNPMHGPWSNSGEGGELKARNLTIFQSAFRQLASGLYGVNGAFLAFARWLQLKFNQAVKPGLGGQLESAKVTEAIAAARFVKKGTKLHSPSANHDKYSIEDVLQHMYDLFSANPTAEVSVKIASDHRVGPVVVGAVKSGAKNITISGTGGGTGAAPITAKYDFCHSWESGLYRANKALTEQGLRSSATITVDGGIQTALDCAKALMLGANNVGLGTPMLVMLGCIMEEDCHSGNCPTGIATQNPQLIKERYKGKPEHIAFSLIHLAKSIHKIFAPYGITHPSQAVGRVDLLKVKEGSPLKGLEELLVKPVNPYPNFKPRTRPPGSSKTENDMIEEIRKGKRKFVLEGANTISSFGARTAYFVQRDESFAKAFSDAPIEVRFQGTSVGQSFGYIAPQNLTLIAERSNDGTGKSLDGGKIYITEAAGNGACFGGTLGNAYFNEAGDRAGIRNSGVNIVAGKIGDMGANFMTGGSLTVLEGLGANFGAGFSGGTIYLLKDVYYKARENGLLSKDVLSLPPVSLSVEDMTTLKTLLDDYQSEIEMTDEKLKALLQSDCWSTNFIKLDLENVAQSTVSEAALQDRSSLSELSTPIVPAMPDVETSALQQDLLDRETRELFDHLPVSMLPDESEREHDQCGVAVLMKKDKIASHRVTDDVFKMLARMAHRGFIGIDPETGDGCGISFYGLTHFFKTQFPRLDLQQGAYCIVPMYLSQASHVQQEAIDLFNQLLAKEGLSVAEKRMVRTDETKVGQIGRELQSPLEQFVVLKPSDCDSEAFEKKLIRVRLQFELAMQLRKDDNRPHILSSSPDFVTYTALTTVVNFGDYFLDFKEPTFEVFGGVVHARAATNTKTRIENIQPLGNFANNGEDNSLQIIIDWLEKTPSLRKLLGIENVDLHSLSDSNIMSIFMDVLRLLGCSPLQIIESTIYPYIPTGNSTVEYNELFGILPFVGPCAGLLMMNGEIIAFRDRNAFRPLVGIENDEYLSLGSEFGIVDQKGKTLRPEPGRPWLIDLKQEVLTIHKHAF
ncbi:MAG: Glutamate synthase, large subunit, partial [uncultured bacterium]